MRKSQSFPGKSSQNLTLKSPISDHLLNLEILPYEDIVPDYGICKILHDLLEFMILEFPLLKKFKTRHIVKLFSQPSVENILKICQEYNHFVEKNSKKFSPKILNKAQNDLLKFILEIAYRNAIKNPKTLNKYPAFSHKVYGEITFDAICEIISSLELDPPFRFIDLGSGVGQVVMQVAASLTCESCYGIEIADIPFNYSTKLSQEFDNLMAFFGKSFSKYNLFQGDFMDSPYKELIVNSNFVIANNFTFGPELNNNLKDVFFKSKDGTNIFSTTAFIPLNFRISLRRACGCFMRVKELKLTHSNAVSWTSKPFSFYHHVVDNSVAEETFQILSRNSENLQRKRKQKSDKDKNKELKNSMPEIEPSKIYSVEQLWSPIKTEPKETSNNLFNLYSKSQAKENEIKPSNNVSSLDTPQEVKSISSFLWTKMYDKNNISDFSLKNLILTSVPNCRPNLPTLTPISEKIIKLDSHENTESKLIDIEIENVSITEPNKLLPKQSNKEDSILPPNTLIESVQPPAPNSNPREVSQRKLIYLYNLFFEFFFTKNLEVFKNTSETVVCQEFKNGENGINNLIHSHKAKESPIFLLKRLEDLEKSLGNDNKLQTVKDEILCNFDRIQHKIDEKFSILSLSHDSEHLHPNFFASNIFISSSLNNVKSQIHHLRNMYCSSSIHITTSETCTDLIESLIFIKKFIS